MERKQGHQRNKKPRTYIDSKGYRVFSDSKKRAHRAVMRKKLGYDIPEGMVVHHIDGDKTNFRPENLRLVTKKEHYKHHVLKKKRGAKK